MQVGDISGFQRPPTFMTGSFDHLQLSGRGSRRGRNARHAAALSRIAGRAGARPSVLRFTARQPAVKSSLRARARRPCGPASDVSVEASVSAFFEEAVQQPDRSTSRVNNGDCAGYSC
jgi:hypothetical protein